MSAFTQRKLSQARDHLDKGEVAAAAALCEAVIERAPRNPEALWLLGTARLMEGRAADAAPLFERALAGAPGDGAMLESLGIGYLMLGRYAEAERVLRQAMAIPGAPASVRMRLGLALLHQENYPGAVAELERVVQLEGDDADARIGLGRAYAGTGAWAAAAREFERVLAQNRNHPDALYNLALASIELQEHARARACLERLVALVPALVDARERLAALLLMIGRYAEAIVQLREVVRAQGDNVPALIALANACFESGGLEEARTAADRARVLDPARAGPYGVLSRIHYVRGEYDRAAAYLEEGHRRSGSCALLGTLVHLRHRMCDWPQRQDAWDLLVPELERSTDCGSPFFLLCEHTSAELQLSYSVRWAGARYPAAGARPPARKRGAGERLRVGYFSPDLHEHATAYLLAEVLELHDRGRFEVFAYSYGPEDGSAMRARLRSAVEHFIDVAHDPDDAIVARMRSDTLDVLVDLKGYTMGERLRVMAQRPCAVQATWVGYPGSTGASFIDYLIADPFVIPPGTESAYSERILRLPHCYQPNDRKRPRPPALPRAQYGLPDDAFVFCCFNQTVKITPEVWSCWLNLLRAAPRSVLWLLEDNRWASDNLRASAGQAGIEAGRLVIAPRVAMPEHLARYGAADLALDTLPYTSHTTASDALWMGCPLLALCGDTFTARVSGSLLKSCGMSDLITYSLEDYAALGHRLATDAGLLREVRKRLSAAHESAPLFDTPSFTRDLEALYLQIAA